MNKHISNNTIPSNHVRSINNRAFYIKDNSPKNLIKLGFDSKEKHDDYECFTYRFPILKYQNITTLLCELTVFTDDKKVRINVYDGLNKPYARFYHNEFGNADAIITTINNNILAKLKKLGISEKDKNNGRNSNYHKSMRRMQTRKS